MHRSAVTSVRLLNWLESGRGQGFGKDYQPFLQVTRQDHASLGQSHILPNQFIGRQHHLLSTLERQVCMLNLAQRQVTDVREQYPAWPFPHISPLHSLFTFRGLDGVASDRPASSQGTVALAKGLRIRHGRFVGLPTPYIYTTDQLLTVELPGRPPQLVAISIKYTADLRNRRTRRRTFQKLRLEREYWKTLGVPWLLVTERQIDPQVVSNLEWCLSGVIQRLQPQDIPLLKRFALAFSAAPWSGRCQEQMDAIASVLGITRATAIRLLKLSVWRALIPVDISRPISLQRPLPKLHGHRPTFEAWSILKKLEGRL